jgi:hypothetical protein
MNNERITIPELLFHPSDIGITQAGMPEMIQQSIASTMAEAHEPLYSNILVFGGNALLPNFQQRLYVVGAQGAVTVSLTVHCLLCNASQTGRQAEVRQLAPTDYHVDVQIASEYVVALQAQPAELSSVLMYCTAL